MLIYKSGNLSKKEKLVVESLLDSITDIYSDFYLTRDNLRLFIKENSHLLFEGLSKGDKIIYGDEGVLFIHGFSDNAPRKYVKILARNEEDASQLLKLLNWNVNEELYAKVKKNNIVLRALQKNGFIWKGSRGLETLVYRKAKTNNFKANKEGDK